MSKHKILANARFVDDGDRLYEAVAVTHGRITAVGDLDDVQDRSASGAEVVDLEGAVVYPGLADNHVHVLNFGRSRMGVSCWPSEVSSVADIVAKVRAAHVTEAPGRWLKGRGYDPARLAEGRAPTATELDLPDERPVVLDSFDFHRRVCNHAALVAAGINGNTTDPPGGQIVRDEHGTPTGELLDNARALLDGVMPPWTPEEDETAINKATQHFTSLGFTHVTNAAPLTMSSLGEEIAAFSRLHRRRELGMRFASMVKIDLAPELVELGVLPGFGDSWFRLTGLKVFADGALGPRSAFLAEPYRDSDSRGSMSMTIDELEDLVAPASAKGWRISVHAQGNAATHIVAEVLAKHPPGGDLQHRIEHSTLTDPETIEMMARAGITPVPQPGFLRFRSGDFLASLGEERLATIFPLRDWIDAGIRPIYSSDAPVIEDARPMPAIATAVTRRDADGNVWGAEQAITVPEAISMCTAWAARATGEESDRGRIAPGYLADFTVFDVDLRSVPVADLGEVEASATIINGEFVWRRG